LPRKTDSNNPADWLFISECELEMIQLAVDNEVSFTGARSKLAEVLEKVIKAELLRLRWELEKTHDLDRLLQWLVKRKSDLVEVITPLCDELADVYFTDRYPGFDLDDPDWPKLRQQLSDVKALLAKVKCRLSGT
jgi:hypothetical protein